ncbi:hypothetical protein [Polyangium sp. 6x1]|uniref:hypothetical protein n=1 Tax=Polyangium sp. 6x1 TaxID=3042689 RepID=UPI002482D82D|nr:hypothetical protein [Polyangium sp. 6x1]MDI1444221.1 hypothetical protein [Polyangium sp. 6x1]
MIDRVVEALAADPDLYQRCPPGELIRVIRAADNEAHFDGGGVEREASRVRAPMRARQPFVQVLPLPALWEHVSNAVVLLKYSKQEADWLPTDPPKAHLEAIMSRQRWNGIRDFAGIVETPTMRPDGSIIDTPGHDARTGFVYIPAADYAPIPERPSRDDARAALAELQDYFCDFPFARPEHLSVVLAAAMSIIVRPAIDGPVPAFVFDAATPGTGKTLLLDAVSVIACGRPASRTTFPRDEEELEKVLAGYAIKAPPLVPFDNLGVQPGGHPIAFGGGPLDKVLTAHGAVDLRVLGKTGQPTLQWYSVIIATGNNVDVLGDTVRRTLMARVEAKEERPDERDPRAFKHHPLLDILRTQHPRLVWCVLVIVRAYIAAERPDMSTGTIGGYDKWAELIPPALVHAGAPNPLLARAEPDDGASDGREHMGVILQQWKELDPEHKGLLAQQVKELLWPADRTPKEYDKRYDGLRSAFAALIPRFQAGTPPTTDQVGKVFRRWKGRVVGALKIAQVGEQRGVKLWAPVAKAARPISVDADEDVEREAIQAEASGAG